MKPQEVRLEDWGRLLTGNLPGWFFWEIIIRATFIYLLILVSMRLMGKRTSAHLSLNERSGVSALAAAIGMPILSPTQGLLPATVVALVVVYLQRWLSSSFTRNSKVEEISQGLLERTIVEGVLQLDVIRSTNITMGRISAELRSHGIRHLGEVKRLYVEASGKFTLIRSEKPSPGLCIIPECDVDFRKEQQVSTILVCRRCGAEALSDRPCGHCHGTERVFGVE